MTDWTPGSRGGFGGQEAPGGAARTVAQEPARPPSIETIPFNALPAVSREALTRAKPLLKGPAKGGGKTFFACLGVLAGVGVLSMAMKFEYGRPYRPQAEAESLLVYAGALLVMAFCGLWLARRFMASKSPFKGGVYLFGTGLVVSDGPNITVYPLSLVTKINTVHQHINGAYAHTTIYFIFPGRSEAFKIHRNDNVGARMDASRLQLRDALMAGDMATARVIDPLIDGIIDPTWGDVEAMQAKFGGEQGLSAASVPKWLGMAPIAGISVAIALLAVPMWMVRNSMSDSAAFDRALASANDTGDVYQLESYARNGGDRADEVLSLHLPRALLTKAQETGEVTPLREFVQRFPETPFAGEARATIHQRFEEVRAEFLAQANPEGGVRAFMDGLLAWLEANDSPPVRVRYAPPSVETLTGIDETLRRRSRNVIPVSPHFTQERAQSRETSVTRALSSGFATVFPADVMRLEHGNDIAVSQASDVPTIDVEYAIQPSGAIYVSERDGRQFVGIHIDFHVSMHIPGAAVTHAFQVAVEPPERFSVSYQTFGGVGNMSEGAVYSTMAERAFDKLAVDLGLAFFAPGSAAYLAAEQRSQRSAEGTRRPSTGLGGTPGFGGGLDPALLDGLGAGGDAETQRRMQELRDLLNMH